MQCESVKDWLLNSERPGLEAAMPAELVEHLRGCADCQWLAQRVQRLEKSWREQPLPASADAARDAFLVRAAEVIVPTPAKAAKSRPWSALSRWAVAAVLLVTIGGTALLLMTGSPAHAESDVIDRLMEWNLQLSEAGHAADRDQIFSQQAALEADLRTAKLSDDDRALGQRLMDNAKWLSTNEEPIEVADRFDTMADQVLTRMQRAAKQKDDRAAQRLARQYQRIAANIDAKLEQANAREAAQKKKVEKINARDAKRMQELEALHQAMPGASKKDLKQIIDSRKKAKPKPAKTVG